MKTSKIFKKAFIMSCALLVPFCELMAAQDETIYTAKYKFNYDSKTVTLSVIKKAKGATPKLSGNYIRSSRTDWKDRVYLDMNNVGTITFTNFKYDVKAIDFSVMAEPSGNFYDNIYTEIIDFSGNSYSNSYRIGSIEGTYFHSNPFLDKEFSSLLKGLKSISMKQLTKNILGYQSTNTVYYQGANDETTPTFSIKYYKPSVYFKSSVSNQIEWGKTYDISNQYSIAHPGAFNFVTSYESTDENIFTVDEKGVITPKITGKAKIKVTIKDGVVDASDSTEIEVVAPNLGNNKYLVTLLYNDGTDRGESVIATYNKAMPTVTPPTRKGYIFRGYYDGQTYSQTEDWANKYYNTDGTSARKWDKNNNNATLYAHWTAKTYTINFNTCGGRLSDRVGIRTEGGEKFIETTNNQSLVSFDVQYDSKLGDRFWCGDVITIRPGYQFLGWYNKRNGGIKVYSIDDKDCSFNAVKSAYWTDNGTAGDWKYDAKNGELDLFAQYECKFEIVDNGERINFKKGYINDNNEFTLFDITSYDIIAAIEEDIEKYGVSPMIVDVTNYQDYILAGKGLVGFLGNKGYNLNEYDNLEAFNTVIEEARLDNKLAPNALVYLSGSKSMYTGATNVVMTNEKQCQNLEVTDRAPIKIPYAFKANKALYERNKNYNDKDAAKAQAANSEWGTLCLPYPIRNNANNVKFYQLAGFEKNIMHYTPMNVDVIPANTPVLYKRLQGVGSEVKIEEAGVDVPVNTSYSTTLGSTLDSWQFIGTLNTKVFCGKDYDKKKMPEGAIKMDGSQEIYYFKQDQFTHLANKGKVTMLPYRAYFTTTAANAKYASFSIVAIDEEGATDITNLIDNDAEGDGKIYDLNGRRVMQPVSGRLYIVNGKKKVY